MKMSDQLTEDFDSQGRIWLRNAVSEADLASLDRSAEGSTRAGQRLGRTAALNTVLSAESSLMTAIRRLAPAAFPVRVVAFNKTDKANWGVPWHQDRLIAVAARRDVAGFNNWNQKAGVWHCEPPPGVLDDMLFVRVHLDDTDTDNGAMVIAAGTHRAGVVAAATADKEARRFPIEHCAARRGDVLILKMLTLHSSKPAKVNTGRRVLRIDFATASLPEPLDWFMTDQITPAD